MEKEEEEEDGEGGDVNSKKLVLQPLPTVKGPNSMQNIEYSLSFFHIFSLSFSFSIYIYTHNYLACARTLPIPSHSLLSVACHTHTPPLMYCT